jgi:hypothetical protein
MQTFKLSVEHALVYQLAMNQRLSKFYKLMGGLEALLVDSFSGVDLQESDAPINFI